MSFITALCRKEGFGLTPLKALASGTAILTSQAGAWKDIIGNGIDGYCVETDNVQATRDALKRLLSSKDSSIEMGKSGRKYVEDHFTVEQKANRVSFFITTVSNT